MDYFMYMSGNAQPEVKTVKREREFRNERNANIALARTAQKFVPSSDDIVEFTI